MERYSPTAAMFHSSALRRHDSSHVMSHDRRLEGLISPSRYPSSKEVHRMQHVRAALLHMNLRREITRIW